MDKLDKRMASIAETALEAARLKIHGARQAINEADTALWRLPMHFENAQEATESITLANQRVLGNQSPIVDDMDCHGLDKATLRKWVEQPEASPGSGKQLSIRALVQKSAVELACHMGAVTAIRQHRPGAISAPDLSDVLDNAEASMAQAANMIVETKKLGSSNEAVFNDEEAMNLAP